MPPTPDFFIPSPQHDHFLSFLHEEDEQEVCREEEWEELLRSVVHRPLLSPPDHGSPDDDEDGLPWRPDFMPSPDDFLSFLRDEDEEEVCYEEVEEQEKEGELLLRPMDRPLLSPPAHGYSDGVDSLPRPDFVLIEQDAYFVDRNNATTASCDARGPDLHGTIKVTFCTAPPPPISFFCVHTTDYTHTDFVIDPLILASETDGGLVLLCLVIGKSKFDLSRPCCQHFFIYDSGTRGSRQPSLKHLPHPGATFGGTYEFNGASLAIVRLCNHPHASCQHEHECDYVIIARDCDFGYESPSYLYFYHSRTDCWGFRTVQVPAAYPGHIKTKTLTVGEDVAWFDLSRNVIFCDVLAETPKVRVVGLPPPINEVKDPRTVRDVVILDGYINYVEVHHQINKGVIHGWMAAKWSMKITGHSEDWHMDHKVYSSNILDGSSTLEANTAHPNFRRLHLGLPNWSLRDNYLVYFLAKINFWDSEQTAWVIAVDLKNNTIHEAVEYNAIKTVGLSIGYGSSRISKYLQVQS